MPEKVLLKILNFLKADAEQRIKRVLRNDPGMGVIRHADAGYALAQETAKENNLDLKSRLL